MYYFMLSGLMRYNIVLIAAAVIPAVFLMIRAYRSDRIERESKPMLWRLVKAGVFSSLIALVAERILGAILDMYVDQGSNLYPVILYFGIVAFSEEGAKYFMLKRKSWLSPEFDCQYDGVVYAVFVSLGFALWENISYVMTYGFATAVVRAVTAIPGHSCFGVFMGVFYGAAKKYDNLGNSLKSKTMRSFCVLFPALIHGAYDYIATTGNGTLIFVEFIAVLFIVSYVLVTRAAKKDRYIA